jgi:hypothetical protein
MSVMRGGQYLTAALVNQDFGYGAAGGGRGG